MYLPFWQSRSLAWFIWLSRLYGRTKNERIWCEKSAGATVSNLVVLISNDFTKLVFIAFIIASPIAWFGLQDFLEYYPYRISISWWILPLQE